MRIRVLALLIGAIGCEASDPEDQELAQPVLVPDSQCKTATFGGIDYWYCANLRTFAQARARCQAIDMDLAVIDSAAEDEDLLSLIDEHAFIGARRTTHTTSWRWIGFDQEFWVGDHNGQAIGGAYTNWEIGHPDPIYAFRRDCGVKKKTAPAGEGRWLSVKCNEPRPYICENLDLCPNNPNKLDPGQCGCAVDDTDTDGDGTADCLDACPLDATKQVPGTCGCGIADADSDGDGIVNCEDGCPNDPTNAQCIALDDLPVAPPLPHIPGANPLPDSPVDPSNCIPETGALQPLPTGSTPTAAQMLALFNSTATPTSNTCTRIQDPGTCPLDEATVETTECTTDAQCTAAHGAGYVCRYGKPAECLTNNTLAFCRTETLRCGLRDAECVADDPVTTCDSTDPTCVSTDPIPSCAYTGTCPCSETPVCSPGAYQTSGPDPGSDLTPETIPTSNKIAANKRTDDPGAYVDPPNSGCTAYQNRCWCKLDVPQINKFDELHAKQSDHGGGGVVNFTFKPDVKFVVDAQPRPFGESNFDLEARATFFARADVSLLGVSDGATLVDIVASARADRCRFRTSDTQVKIFGIDFVDVLDLYDTDAALATQGSECSTAFDNFEASSHRAKKALRDAQVLVEAYRALPANVGFDPVQFCGAVFSPDSDFPTGTCASEVPEQTINRFITYYNQRTSQLRVDMRTLQAKSVALASALAAAKPNNAIPFLDYSHSDGKELVNLPFFIGPIPMTLEIEILLNYGLKGEMVYSFTPTSILAMPAGTPVRLVSAAAKLVPGASAVLDMFVGAGFSVPGFSAKAGISGEIVLAKITSNLEAGVGLSTISKTDDRTLPADLAAISTGELVFPLRAHQLFADWFIGAKAGLEEILSGKLNAKVKLKALFFSKTWKKTIVSYSSPFGPYELELLKGGDRLGGIVLPASALAKNSLGLYEMQLPFVEIDPLPVPASQPASTQPITIPTTIGQLGYTDFCIPPVPK